MFLPIGDDVNKREFPVVAIMLIAINFVVYCYQFRLELEFEKLIYTTDLRSAPDSAIREILFRTEYYKFIKTWGCSADNVKKGHFMCLVTATFLHGGFWHLFGNMIVLWALAGTLENALGPGRFFFMYLLWGVGASLVDVGFSWDRDVPSIGASGAIAGMLGAYFITFGALTKIRCLVFIFLIPLVVNIPAALFGLLWLLTQFSGLDAAQKYGGSHVAWYAHLGGFFVGLVSMYVFALDVKRRMYRDEKGVLHFHSEEEMEKKASQAAAAQAALAAPVAAAETAVAPEPPPQPVEVKCPYCGTVLPEEAKIHANLLRCKACDRLIMK